MWTFNRTPDRHKPICLPDRSGEQSSAPASRLPLKRRLMVLAAAVAVPAMAAPGDFGAIAADAPGDALESRYISVSAMSFEQPGASFPGSAFYYLADPPKDALVALPNIDPLDTGTDGPEVGALIDAGPAASPFASLGSGTSQSRALQCLSQAIYYEAASESDAGQRAVAQVVLNRVTHTSWPSSVCGVVYQGSQRKTGCQFTFTCDGSLRRKASAGGMAKARRIASEALSGSVYSPIGLATHYHTLWVNPYWASSLDHIGTVGAHRFYKNKGRAGTKAAFSQRYAGYEPSAGAAAASRSAELTPRIDPVPVTAAPTSNARTRATLTPAQSPMRRSAPKPSTPDAVLANDNLRAAGQVKAPYSNAGQWKDSAAAALAAEQKKRIEVQDFTGSDVE